MERKTSYEEYLEWVIKELEGEHNKMKDRQATAYEQASQILKLQDEIFELKQKLKYAEYRISIMTGASNFEQSE